MKSILDAGGIVAAISLVLAVAFFQGATADPPSRREATPSRDHSAVESSGPWVLPCGPVRVGVPFGNGSRCVGGAVTKIYPAVLPADDNADATRQFVAVPRQ